MLCCPPTPASGCLTGNGCPPQEALRQQMEAQAAAAEQAELQAEEERAQEAAAASAALERKRAGLPSPPAEVRVP